MLLRVSCFWYVVFNFKIGAHISYEQKHFLSYISFRNIYVSNLLLLLLLLIEPFLNMQMLGIISKETWNIIKVNFSSSYFDMSISKVKATM